MQYNIYISHSFEHSEKYDRLVEFIRDEELPSVNLSVPVGRQLPGDLAEIRRGIAERIRWCNRVLVLVTDNAHRSPCMDYEMRIAAALGKTIIGVYPHGENEGPIPSVLADTQYRMVGWRRGSLAKAIQGEYPLERRVFDIAEVEERRELITKVGLVAAATTFVVAGLTAIRLGLLLGELKEQGINVVGDKGPGFLETAGPSMFLGIAGGIVLSILLTGDGKSIGKGAMIGGAIGLAVGTTRYLRMRVEELSPLLSTVVLEPVTR